MKGWKECKIRDICDVVRGASPRPAGDPKYFNGDYIPWITVADVTKIKGMYLYSTKSNLTKEGSLHTRIIASDTLILTNSGATLGVPKITKIEAGANDGIAIFLDLKEISKEYLYYILEFQTDYFRGTLAPGNGQPNLNTDLIKGEKIFFPLNAVEQNKIVSILKDTDHAIETTERLIVAKERYFDGLLQKLLSYLNSKQPEISLQSITIGDILKEFSRKTTINNQHILLSVTKNGICAQDEHFNKQIASNNNIGYKIIQRDNVVFSTMNLWMGSLDVLKQYDVGIVSPAYKTFEINTSLANIDFIQFFLKSPYMLNLYDLYSGQGASIVRRNLDLQGLLASTIKIPYLEHQAKIAEVLNTAKREIDLLKKLAESYRLQKQGLMQKLLSGEWRVAA